MKKTYLYLIVVLAVLVIAAIGWTLMTSVGAFTINFDFSLSASPRIGTVGRSQSSTSTITVALTKGRTQNVQLSLSGCPTATTCSLSRTSGNPTFISTLTVQTTSGTPLGASIITVNGVGGGKTRSTTYALTVNPYCPDGVCEAGETCSSCQQDCGCQSGYTCINSTCQQQCTCGAWTNGACNAGGCTNQRQQTRTCTPSGCDITTQCIADASCVTNPASCTDTDGGTNYNITGTVSGYMNNTQYSYTDYCSGSILREYYCSGTIPLSSMYPCNITARQCINGACV